MSLAKLEAEDAAPSAAVVIVAAAVQAVLVAALVTLAVSLLVPVSVSVLRIIPPALSEVNSSVITVISAIPACVPHTLL